MAPVDSVQRLEFWWRIDPVSGETLGISQRGWGEAATEYSALTATGTTIEVGVGFIARLAILLTCFPLVGSQPKNIENDFLALGVTHLLFFMCVAFSGMGLVGQGMKIASAARGVKFAKGLVDALKGFGFLGVGVTHALAHQSGAEYPKDMWSQLQEYIGFK